MAEVVGGGVQTISWDELKSPDDAAALARSAEGAFVRVNIPASDSSFTPRQAIVYLPPSYFKDPSAQLPVIVLMSGQPGTPQDWLVLGKLPQTMDQFASRHDGRAPIVAVVDVYGSQAANPLCSDTSHGKVATYVQKDVPTWLHTNFPVSSDPGQWAVAGLSSGGTCALQVVTRAPDLYRSFLDMSGEAHPQLGNEERTIPALYHHQYQPNAHHALRRTLAWCLLEIYPMGRDQWLGYCLLQTLAQGKPL